MLELNEQNIKVIANLKQKNIVARNAWVKIAGAKASVIVPQEDEDFERFIKTWLPLCPHGTEKKLKDYEKEIRKEAKKKGYVVEDWHLLILNTRKIAKIKKEYTREQNELMVKANKKYNLGGVGYTYLSEIVYILDTILNQTLKDFPNLIARYEKEMPRKRV